MKQLHVILVLAVISFVTGCASTSDKAALQEAKNKDSAMQTKKARDLETQKQIILLGTAAALSMQQSPTNSNEDSSTPMPPNNFTISAIDDGFQQWSSAWMIDRYVPGSARITEKGVKDDAQIIRGLFDFVRGGSRTTIPYAAAFTNSGTGYKLSNLCYNDHSSGMTDCINPTDPQAIKRARAQSGQFLGAVALIGIAAAVSMPDDAGEEVNYYDALNERTIHDNAEAAENERILENKRENEEARIERQIKDEQSYRNIDTPNWQGY